ncbi:MAG: hypothetical protein PUJ61_10140 [Spirochaetia bacterium]|nr:hypothetical protein [Spirochaetia bacterium]
MSIFQTKRIVINILVTYGRSLLALFCGLFSTRWALQALGKLDYGLLGIVGGLIGFVSFFNGVLSTAVSRFYAFSVGKTYLDPKEGLQQCRKWFNTALTVHTVVPCILLGIGYPIGVYAIKHWLVIPADKVSTCIWVFRFTCASSLAGMISVPYTAMFIAKQWIAELTVYNILITVLNFLFLAFIAYHPGKWLLLYSLFSSCINIIIQIMICYRGHRVFPECKVVRTLLCSIVEIKELFSFAGWQLFGCLGVMLRSQGMAVIVNKAFGPSVNAAHAVSNNIVAHTNTLASSLTGAFSPAIINACGAKQYGLMRKSAFLSSKIGSVLMLIFALPLVVELPYILKIWLVSPPEYTVGLCRCVLIMSAVDKLSEGHMIAVHANGKIAAYQFILSLIMMSALPISYIMIKCHIGVYSIGYSLLSTMCICSIGRCIFAKYLVDMPLINWFKEILIPISITIVISLACGMIPSSVINMEDSLLRVLLTTICIEIPLLTGVWMLMFNREDREKIMSKAWAYIHCKV